MSALCLMIALTSTDHSMQSVTIVSSFSSPSRFPWMEKTPAWHAVQCHPASLARARRARVCLRALARVPRCVRLLALPTGHGTIVPRVLRRCSACISNLSHPRIERAASRHASPPSPDMSCLVVPKGSSRTFPALCDRPCGQPSRRKSGEARNQVDERTRAGMTETLFDDIEAKCAVRGVHLGAQGSDLAGNGLAMDAARRRNARDASQ